MIRIVAIGKRHESWVREGIERYEKRLQKPFDVEWVLLPHSSLEGLTAREKESEAILHTLNDDDFVVLLDERGSMGTAEVLSTTLSAPLERSQRVVCIIGGAYGVDERVHARANQVWSLSKQVFPHQLVRLIITEQIYRAQEIRAGRPYHHA